ncbi:hypothetical protein T12_16644 [Trichinella patagoniensis]|uniref:Uncharacterized protein n=1 Tax=Trichinella patagoniensis TaxID=990121 RepID=A0A0V0Z3P2_9BILA|nr:hypothetical protein T12_16644 [Trichinella patagoniensis]
MSEGKYKCEGEYWMGEGYAWGYASGNFLKISKFFEI